MRAIDRRPAEEDKDRITGVVRSNLQRRISTPMSLRTYKTVSDTERLSARMTKASYINLTEGTHAAQLYTNQHIPGYRLDTQLTDEHGAVFYNRTTNDLRVAYRGTQTNFDWTTNLRMASMMENNSSQIQALETQMKLVEAKYNRKPDILTGHSKGGGQSILMGERHGITTHTQDPFIPTRQLLNGAKSQHFVVRTPTDVVSAGSNLAKFRQNFTETIIEPKAGTSVLQSHDLNLVTGVPYQGSGNTAYHPLLKDSAFLTREMQRGQTLQQVEAKLNYSGDDLANLRRRFAELEADPAAHPEVLRMAGYHEPTGGGPGLAMRTGSTITSLIGETTSKVVNLRTGAGIAGGLGAAYALQKLGLDNDMVVATAAGAVGNVSSDAIGSFAARMAGSKASVAGLAGFGKSFAKGGVGGILGFGVEMGTRAALTELGVDSTVTDVASGMAGGAAAGALFGPEGAALGAAVGGGIAAIEDLIHEFQPKHDYLLSPFRNKSIDLLIGTDPEVQALIKKYNETGEFRRMSHEQYLDEMRQKAILERELTDLIRRKAARLGWGHDYIRYEARLSEVPRGYSNQYKDHLDQPTVMLSGDYTAIEEQEHMQEVYNEAQLTHSKSALSSYDARFAGMSEEQVKRERDRLFDSNPWMQESYLARMNHMLGREYFKQISGPEDNVYSQLLVANVLLTERQEDSRTRSRILVNQSRLRQQLERGRQMGLDLPSYDDVMHHRAQFTHRGNEYPLLSPHQIDDIIRQETTIRGIEGDLDKGRSLGMHLPEYSNLRNAGYTPQRLQTEVRQAETQYRERLTRITQTSQTSVYSEDRPPAAVDHT